MIEIFGSVLEGGSKELHTIEHEWLLLDWLHANGISRDVDLDSLPMAVFHNDQPLSASQWGTTRVTPADSVDIFRVPKGTDPFSITFGLIFGAKAALKALMPKLPTQKTPNIKNSGQGNGLDEANAKGNKVKLNSIRTQCFGMNPARYPDFATPSRRYFAAPREQRIEMCMFVGEGQYQIPTSRVKIGETALNTMGSNARFNIYQPGESLELDPAHLNWCPAPEVGPSSSGSPGLELTVSTALTPSVSASAFNFNGFVVSIPAGAGSIPSDWGPGILVSVGSPYSYTVTDGDGNAGRDVIRGDIASLAIPTGSIIEIAGSNPGTYTIFSQTSTTLQLNYLGGAPAVGLVIGTVTMVIGYPNFRFRIVNNFGSGITVARLLENGSTDTTWPGWPNMTSNQGQVRLDDSNYSGGYRGPFPACPVGETVDAIEWSVLYNSLIGITPIGEEYGVLSLHDFEYRDMALGGAWTVLRKTVSGQTFDTVGFTFRETMPYPMRAECRIKRLPKQGTGATDDVRDSSQWYSLFGLIHGKSPLQYEGMTMMTCDIRGGDRLSTTAENLVSIECTRILPVLRGGVWQAAEPTREISATVGHICRDSGYSDTEDLNIVELERLELTRWTPRGEYYDKIVTEQDTVKGYLLQALTPGFSELTIDRGVLVPVRDEPRGESFDHVYNPRVMLKPMKRNFVAGGLPDQFDGVDVTYFDHITKQNETVQCRLPGDLGTKVKKETLEGVGDRTRAWRWGMRVRRGYLYRQGSYEFETELAGLNSSYMSYAGLGDSTPKRGQNAEVISYAENEDGTVTLGASVNLDWSKPGKYMVVVRRLDGTASGPHTATRVDSKHFTIPELDFVPQFNGDGMMNPIIQFGHADRWIYPALITEVKPKGTKSCSMTAVNYDVRMFADDDNFPPAEA